jgi:hypothetical protein
MGLELKCTGALWRMHGALYVSRAFIKRAHRKRAAPGHGHRPETRSTRVVRLLWRPPPEEVAVAEARPAARTRASLAQLQRLPTWLAPLYVCTELAQCRAGCEASERPRRLPWGVARLHPRAPR